MALNCFPAVEIVKTSLNVSGQVYVPAINWLLMIGSIAVTVAFQSTASIGNAFGGLIQSDKLLSSSSRLCRAC